MIRRHPARPKLRPSLLWLSTLFLILAVAPTFAAERVLTLEPETTEVSFFLEATGHDVEGRLHLKSGRIAFDLETGAASGDVEIDARRAETGNAKRDKKMHKEVLESEAHPLIRFVPERVVGEIAADGPSEIELVGTVTLLGEEHPMTLPTTVEIAEGSATAKSVFVVPYVEWGLEDPSILFLRVAKEVEVTLTARGSLTTPETAIAATER